MGEALFDKLWDLHTIAELEHRSVTMPAGETFHFDMVDTDAKMLLNGWDPVTLTLRCEEKKE